MTASMMPDVIWFIRALLWAVLFWNSIRHRLVLRYRLFFSYAAILVALDLVMPLMAAWLGVSSSSYAYLYFLFKFCMRVLESALLLRMYWLFRPPRLATDWHLILIPLAYLSVTCVNEPRPLTYLLIVGGEGAIVAYLGASVLYRMIRNRRMDLGWNLKMILFAVTVPGSFHTIILTVHRMQLLPFETTHLWLKGADLMFWIILAAGMSEYSPPRWADGAGMFHPRTALPNIEAENAIEKNLGGTR